MAATSVPQVILLPIDNYWGWLQAVRDYAVHFRVSVTHVPQNALSYQYPNQVITVVDIPSAYGVTEDVTIWLSREAPGVAVDVLQAESPGALKKVLLDRVACNMRFGNLLPAGHAAFEFRLRWPTEFASVTQAFGVNPDIYRGRGQAGHDGVDILAASNTKIFACADGIIAKVITDPDATQSGIQVQVQHRGGYSTEYSHLNHILVEERQAVQAGDLLGLAGDTGQSAGGHLHLTLRKDGATASGETGFADDQIDPLPFLNSPAVQTGLWRHRQSWVTDRSIFGMRARIGAPLGQEDWALSRHLKIQGWKFGIQNAYKNILDTLKIAPTMFMLVQVPFDFQGPHITTDEFLARLEIQIRPLYDIGARYFELGNSPNLVGNGLGKLWHSGEQFGEWFVKVMKRLRAEFPDAKWGWPGLSVGTAVTGVRLDYKAFLEGARDAVSKADWVACYGHFVDETSMISEYGGLAYQYYLERWPDRMLLLTEFSNPSPAVPMKVKGQQYRNYLAEVFTESGIGGVFAFAISSAKSGYETEVWLGSEGKASDITKGFVQ